MNNMEKIKVVLADDHKVFLDGLESIFRGHEEIEVVGLATHGQQVLSLVRSCQPQVVVLDIGMPGLDGVEATRRIIQEFPSVSILILSVNGEIAYIRKLKEMGVHGYLLKETDKWELERAVKILSSGGMYFSAAVREIESLAKTRSGEAQPVEFTKKEKLVLGGLAKGWGNEEIANDLAVQVSTIETHLKNIREKTGISGQRALVKYAIEGGY